MYDTNGKSIIRILKKALSFIDKRLINHGERVAYIVYMLKMQENKYSLQDIYEYCMVATLHDIGAYKVEQIDDIFSYEAKEYEEHCYYGYLYLKYFTILEEKADAILYHHEPFSHIDASDCKNKDIAKIISFADRFDVFLTLNKGADVAAFKKSYYEQFPEEYFDLLEKVNKSGKLIEFLNNGTYSKVIEKFFFSMKTERDKFFIWLRSFAFLIDFRSPVTLAHTMTTESIAAAIARHMNLPIEDVKKVTLGAFLHDIGKISTPHNILQKNGHLDTDEMEIMRKHVVNTRVIIEGNIDADIVNIAARHHEKLDGSGYPEGLTEKDLSQLEKIVAVADIASALASKRSYKSAFPIDKIESILSDMAQRGKICKKATQTLLDNKEEILKRADQVHNNLKEYYDLLIEEFIEIKNKKLICKKNAVV